MEEPRAGLEERFSPTAIRFCWTCFVCLHVVGFAYYGFTAWSYWNLPGTLLDNWLSMYYLGIGTQYDRTIAVFMGIIAVIHSIYFVWMVAWSYKKKQLVFAVYNVFQTPRWLIQLFPVRRNSRSVYPKGTVNYIYRAFFARDGLLGVDGPYFDVILFIREIVGTALQTHQAYRMSLLLPRVEVNRGYVALLVVNCWTTALVHNVFHANSTKRRVWSLVSDCILDTVTSMGITSVLIASYIRDFNFKTSGFPSHKWYEDVWIVHAISEFQIILVTSWRDLGTRILFALSLLTDMNNMKMAMRARRRKRKSKSKDNRATMIAPYFAAMEPKRGPSANLLLKKRTKDMLSQVSQFVFFVWGLVILTLHIYAETSPQFPQCWMQVRPWLTMQPSCSLLVLDCYADQISGSKTEVSEQWTPFNPASITRTVIRHCPVLQIPEILTSFSHLSGIKIYNSTIDLWDINSALTQTQHPSFLTLFLVRVEFSGGELPAGLQSTDFPQSAGDIEICMTNLRTLPDDIDLKWPQFASIYIEASQLQEVPGSLVRLSPYDLSLSMNPISELPAQLFEADTVGYLSFGSTLITQLPEAVAKLSSVLSNVNLSYNNLSFLWPWIDPIITTEPSAPLLLAGTPYCRDLQRIFAGKQTIFSSIPPQKEPSIFSNASVVNWDTLKNGVSCAEEDKTWYSIDFEDKYSSVGKQT